MTTDELLQLMRTVNIAKLRVALRTASQADWDAFARIIKAAHAATPPTP